MNPDRIRFCQLRSGHVHPAEILRTIEDEFERAKLERRPIDRVVVDDLGHWELACPAVMDDETFPDTLVNLLQRSRATSLMVCGDVSDGAESSIQRSVLSRATCIIGLHRLEFRGRTRVSLRVEKTRGMNHVREAQELAFERGTPTLRPSISMFRVSRDGEAQMVPVRLLFHAETEAQSHYASRLAATLGSLLSTETRIEPQSAISVRMSADLVDVSAIDELQIIHLDEYQLPGSNERQKSFALRTFKESDWNASGGGNWNDFVPRLAKTARGDGGELLAAPFYADIGFLAYRTGVIEGLEDRLNPDSNVPAAEIWHELSARCKAWEEEHVRAPAGADLPIFFDFPHVTLENYSCLFLEILASLCPPLDPGIAAIPVSPCRLLRWLGSDAVLPAGEIFWTLCSRAHEADLERRRAARAERALSGHPNVLPHSITSADKTLNFDLQAIPASQTWGDALGRVSRNAVVWRHWYSTLSQMLTDMTLGERAEIRVVPVPGQSIAGEWYMAIPSYSAAPDVGVRILRHLATPQSNSERLHGGVGLPTLRSFYERGDLGAKINPHFAATSRHVLRAIDQALPRSTFGCYGDYSVVLGHNLVRMLESPKDRLADGISQLRAELHFARSTLSCSHCQV